MSTETRKSGTKTLISAAILAGLVLLGACGGDPAAPAAAPSGDHATPTALATARGCSIVTEGEVDTFLGSPSFVSESPLQGGHWCSWKPEVATLTQLELTMVPGEDRFDEAMGSAERGGGLHDTDEALGDLAFSTDDGSSTTVAWVRDGESVVLSLHAGDVEEQDLVVLAKAIDARLSS